MRIISGSAGGRRLTAPSGDKTRPTSDKIRGSLFNILQNIIPDAMVLDLFGGTGALALEALSRGAAGAVIVDSDRNAVEAIKQNIRAVLGEDENCAVRLIKSDFRRAISQMSMPFDVIFLDPPYALTGAYAEAISLLDARGLIKEDAVIVCERRADVPTVSAKGFTVTDTRKYGDTAIDFLYRDNEIMCD